MSATARAGVRRPEPQRPGPRPIRVRVVTVMAVAAVMLGLAAGCRADPDAAGDGGGAGSGGGAGGQLAGRTFLSESVRGAPVELVPDTRIRLEFTGDGRLVAHAGCNTLSAGVSTGGGVLTTTGVGSTEIGCDPARHRQDRWLAEFLGGSPRWAVDADLLTLTGGGIEMVLRDRETADPDRPLERTSWTVDTLVRGDTASSMVAGTEGSAWLVLDGGTFTARTGCRDLTGLVSIGDGVLRFSDVAWNEGSCPPELTEVDRLMREVLSGEVAFEVEAARLRLTHPAGTGLGLSAGR